MDTKEFIKKTWFLNRVAVGKDSEQTCRLIKKEVGGELYQFSSGTECLTWIIPPEWIVKKAILKDPKGKIIADFDKNPLYLASYSISFNGKMHLGELKKHLFYNEAEPNEIPYHFSWQYQYGKKDNWGFCVPFNVYNKLRPGKYEVEINTEFQTGKLFLNDIFLPGEKKDTIFFIAHTCHPAQINDGIGCVAMALEIAKYLKKKKKRKYSYRFIFGSEYFAGAAYLEKFGKNNLKYGFSLENIANQKKIYFDHSFEANTYIDIAVKIALEKMQVDFKESGYRETSGNDEMFYDGPGFNIPTVCFGRLPAKNNHTSADNLKNFDFKRFKESKNILIQIINLFEEDTRIIFNKKGPIYLSRYDENIFKDKKISSNQMQKAQLLLDKGFSYIEVSHDMGIDFDIIKQLADIFLKNNLAFKK